MPPRHGKSQLSSIFFPAWYIGRNPKKEIITASYSTDLATDFGRQVRNLASDRIFQAIFPGVELAEDSQARGRWHTNSGGGYVATGVGGSITGRGANCISEGERVLTKNGPIPIEKIKAGDFVTTVFGERKVLCVFNRGVRAVRKIVSGDSVLLCTDDHDIMTPDGWRKADQIKPNDFIYGLDMSSLQKGICAEGKQAEQDTEVLFSSVQSTEAVGRIQTSKKKVCGMWRNIQSSFRRKTLLFSKLLSDKNKQNRRMSDAQSSCLSCLRKVFQAIFLSHKVLFNGLQEQEPRQAHGDYESELQDGEMEDLLPKEFQEKDLKDAQRKISSVYALLEQEKITNSPSGREQEERYMGQSGSPLPILPCQVTSNEKAGSKRVYDLTIEEYPHFFASSFLVHNCMIIDDPLKDREEAESEVIRNKVWEWYTSTAYTRLSPDGAIVLIQTRWHDDDLAGRILAHEKDKWIHLNFPAILDDPESPQGKRALWPEQYSLEKLNEIKESIGSRDWACLFQQNPINEETQEFKKSMFRYYSDFQIPAQMRVLTGVDPAISKKEKADSSVVFTLGVLPGEHRLIDKIFFLEYTNAKFDPSELIDEIFYHHSKWKSEVIAIETTAYQEALAHFLRDAMLRRGQMLNIEEIKHTTDKEKRIRGLIPYYKEGLVYHRTNMQELEEQLLRFPYGKHDDILDAACHTLPFWIPKAKTLFDPQSKKTTLKQLMKQEGLEIERTVGKSYRWR